MASVKERPETLSGFTTKVKTGFGNLYLTVNECEGKPFEVFAIIGKSGRSTTAKTEAIGRLVSLALRSGIDLKEIVAQLKGIGGEHPVFQEGRLVLSVPDAIGRVLEKQYLNIGKPDKSLGSLKPETSPECGGKLRYGDGEPLTWSSCGHVKGSS
jgi:ribonucleoside-diphosphate reductase alpha chain